MQNPDTRKYYPDTLCKDWIFNIILFHNSTDFILSSHNPLTPPFLTPNIFHPSTMKEKGQCEQRMAD